MKDSENMSIEETLFSILKNVLSENKEQGSALTTLDIDTFNKVFCLAEKHDIAHIVVFAYSNAGMLGNDMISEKYRKKLMLAFYRGEQRRYVLSDVSNAFDEIKINYIPLKGAVISKFYPEPWMRSSCDIDILIHENDADQAIKCLCKKGYKLQKSTSIHDYSFFAPSGVHLELHFSLIQEDCLMKANEILKSAWDYIVGSSAHSYQKNLCDEMFMFYHIAHMAKHFIKGGCGIRPFIDLWVLNRKLEFDYGKLKILLSDAQLLDFYTALCKTIEVWFGNGMHDNVTVGIEKYILEGGVYGTITNAATIAAVTGESRVKSFSKLMFMSRASLEILYPQLERYPFLFPFYQVKRWFRVFNTSKRNKIKYLTHVRNSITKEEINSVTDLLYHLGLNENK